MTDYLELLLEEQEQEDGEEALGVQLMAEGEPYRRKKPGDKVEEAVEALARSGGAWERLPRGAGEAASGVEDGGRWREAWVLEPLAERALGGVTAAGGGRKQVRGWSGDGAVGALEGGAVGEAGASPVRPVSAELPEADGREVPLWLSGETAAAGREREWVPEGLVAVREGRGDAGWLYRRLRAGEAAAGYRPRGGETVTVVERSGGPAGGGLSPEELDRVLERDARRYDGGFALF